MTKKRVLIINSDLAKNRGDRAIAEGIIELVKQRFPDASITGISQNPTRDKKWYDIDFLDMNFQSLNPIDLLRLCIEAHKSDFVLWGGGEILKDYTNKTALWYWVVKITILSMANKNIYGTYQGIGPTKSASSKKLIVSVANRCKGFILRDRESYEKLIAWGCSPEILSHASDPAVLPQPQKINSPLSKKLELDFDVDTEFLDNFICIGPRDWFHYKQGGLLPFKYKRRLQKLFRIQQAPNPKHDTYIRQLSKMVSELAEQQDSNILLVPMHMEESDTELCQLLKRNSPQPEKIRILDKDTLSPQEVRSTIAMATAMVGFRLHSNIIGISAGVPSVNVYYVDKGRVFFDQIKQSKYALPIEDVLSDDFVSTFVKRFDAVLRSRKKIKQNISSETQRLRKSVQDEFGKMIDD